MKKLIIFIAIVLFSSCNKEQDCTKLWIEKDSVTGGGIYLTPYNCGLSETQNLHSGNCDIPGTNCRIIHIP